jgi:TorA maturation chaperone TorD
MEIDKIIEGRRAIYALFATLFLDPPPRNLLEDVFNGVEIPFFENLNILSKKFKDVDEFEDSVKDEFSSLFVNPFAETVSPYQSSYEGENPYGKTTLRIVEKYSNMGYEFRYNEPADHIGVELFFLAESCKNALASDKTEKIEELRKQKQFIEEELNWVTSFCDEIEKNDNSYFYRAISKKLKEFLRNERILINELIVSALKP